MHYPGFNPLYDCLSLVLHTLHDNTRTNTVLTMTILMTDLFDNIIIIGQRKQCKQGANISFNEFK